MFPQSFVWEEGAVLALLLDACGVVLVVRHATWEAWWSAKERWRSLEERGDGECSKGGVSGVRERLWENLGR